MAASRKHSFYSLPAMWQNGGFWKPLVSQCLGDVKSVEIVVSRKKYYNASATLKWWQLGSVSKTRISQCFSNVKIEAKWWRLENTYFIVSATLKWWQNGSI